MTFLSWAFRAGDGRSKGSPMQQYISDYLLVQDIPPGDYHFTGNSIGNKQVAKYAFADRACPRTLLDIGFGVGDLGRIIKTDDGTQHWQMDGIDGFRDTCCNEGLFAKRYYRNIWHGLAQELPPEQLRAYDAICLFDVIEHLDVTGAQALLKSLLEALGPDSRLILSTPLWFWPQSRQNPDDLEEHLIGVPASSLLRLQPVMFTVDPRFLVGTFVFTRKSLVHVEQFQPTPDRSFNQEAGRAHLEALGYKADGVLYMVQ
jgi:SAM-dependent methyltransferase